MNKPSYTKEDIRQKRKSLMGKATEKSYINKGDKRIKGIRVCSVCGNKLTRIVVRDGSTRCIRSHTRCKMDSFVYTDVCRSAQMCYRQLRKKGELDENA